MNRLAIIGIIAILAVAVSSASWATDGNGNGFDDAFERPMAVKFCPALVLDAGDNHVSPEPVEIMGPLWATMLYVPTGGQYSGELITQGVVDGAHDYSQYDSWEDAANVAFGYSQGDYGCGFRNSLTMFWHWDYAGTGAAPGGGNDRDCTTPISPADYDQPLGWHHAYANGRAAYVTPTGATAPALKPGDQYPTTTYCHLFKADGKYVLQYWFFYPFNDWVTDHEGDWEHINVVVTSDDPATAQLVEVAYYFHHRYLVTTENQLQDPVNYDYHVVDTFHPVVFVGGYSSKTIFTGEHGSGYGSHGCYPAVGLWASVEQNTTGIYDEDISGDGDYVDWRTFAWNSCEGSKYGIVLIRNRNTYDFSGADKSMSWLSARIPWGSTVVRSLGNTNDLYQFFGEFIPAIGAAPLGPEQHDSWLIVDTPTDEYSLYGINPRPQANQVPFAPPPPLAPPAETISMFDNAPFSQPLHDIVSMVGTTCLPGATVSLSWRESGSNDEWSSAGVNSVRPYSPLVGDIYATWNTGVVPAGTYTLRAQVQFAEDSFEETINVTVQHRSTTVDDAGALLLAGAWAEMGDTIYVQGGTYSVNNLLLEGTVQLTAIEPVEFVASYTYPAIRVENDAYPATISGITIRSEGATYNTRYGITVTNSRLTLKDCAFVGIHGEFGSALQLIGDSDVSLYDCEFSEIRGEGPFFAGPVFLNGGSLSAVDCVFQSNGPFDSVSPATSVISAYNPTSLSFERCSFTDNSVANGVVFVSNTGGQSAVFSDCSFVNNIGVGDLAHWNAAAAIFCEDAVIVLDRCTVAGTASRDGLDYPVAGILKDTASNVSISRSIIAYNHGSAVYAPSGSLGIVSMSNGIVFENLPSYGGPTDEYWDAASPTILNINPAFCNAATGDYRLYAFSPAAAPAPPNLGYFDERVGAHDIGCVPSATVTAESSSPIPDKPHIVVTCPQGDLCRLKVTVNLEGAISRSIDTSEIVLDAADCTATVRVYDQDGFITAETDAVGSTFQTTIEPKYLGGYGIESVDVLLNGVPLASKANFELRSVDVVPDGHVFITDFGKFGASNPSPPKPYDKFMDYNDDSASTLSDFGTFGGHYNHIHPAGYQQLNPASDPAPSDAAIELAFTEEFPTATSHLLYVDVDVANFGDVTTAVFSMKSGSNRLAFAEWVPAEGDLGEVMFAPVNRDGSEEYFFGALVSESFEGTSSHLGRLVFEVTGTDPVEITDQNFVLTVGDLILEGSPSNAPVVARMESVLSRTFDPAVARVYYNRLEPNFPNPFNPTTTLAFSIKDAGNVRLTIYDVGGRRIRELVNDRRERGAYKVVWDGQNDAGQVVASGVYFYKLVAGSFADTKKMTILK